MKVDRIHLVAIGGSIMHNLALALHASGKQISGSDDEIYEPSKSRLQRAGLHPVEMGWDANRITSDIDLVIAGMHARADNPEILRATEMGLRLMSFPEYIRSQSDDKTRIVVAGSHGKTTTTGMIMHALRTHEVDFDYLVGAQLPGFDFMVRLSDAPVIILEGDEYLSSALDRRPKFVHYDPHVAIITGVAWDHKNVFATEEIYNAQFELLVGSLEPDGFLILCAGDPVLDALADIAREDIHVAAYDAFPHKYLEDGVALLSNAGDEFNVPYFGGHNFENTCAAGLVCAYLGLAEEQFLRAMQSFTGADMRLQIMFQDDKLIAIRDFAHAPSKVAASTRAVKERFPDQILIAILELHTFSSLSADFIQHYRGTLNVADRGFIYRSAHAVAMKKLPELTDRQITDAFGGAVEVFNSLDSIIQEMDRIKEGVHLWMSSGRFENLDFSRLYHE